MDQKNAIKTRARKKQSGSFHHGDLRESLVAVTSQLIEKRKSVDFSLREIAEKTGVSHPAVFKHFSQKTNLLAEVARRGFLLLADLLKDANQSESDTLHQCLKAYVGFALKKSGYFRAMFHQSLIPFDRHQGLAEAASVAFDLLESAVEKQFGFRDKEFVLMAWSQAHGIAALANDDQIQGPFAISSASTKGLIEATLDRFVEIINSQVKAKRR